MALSPELSGPGLRPCPSPPCALQIVASKDLLVSDECLVPVVDAFVGQFLVVAVDRVPCLVFDWAFFPN